MRRAVALIAVVWLSVSTAAAQRTTERNLYRAREIARQHGWSVRSVDASGRIIALRAIIRGVPCYCATRNINAADSVSADECWPGGSGGFNLTGSGVTLGIWDGGAVYVSHPEFGGRVTQQDAPSEFSDHATHVSGTMIASGMWPGNPAYPQYPAGMSKGMSYMGQVSAYDWDWDSSQDQNDPNHTPEMATAAAGGLRASNHSYGLVAGWYGGFGFWFWLGDASISEVEDYKFGRYSEWAQEFDQVAYDYPQYLFVTAAGNDRDDTGPAPGEEYLYIDSVSGEWVVGTTPRNPDGNGTGYDTSSDPALHKNGLTIGAVVDVIGGYQGPDSVVSTSFSSWGPADDGRIKPDVVGNGWELFSPVSFENGYAYWNLYSGTSMASPNVTGSCGLLIQQWRDTHPGEPDMRSSTLKAVVIHTADESGGFPGPDYAYGWGLVNALRAAQTIAYDTEQPLTMSEHELSAATPSVSVDVPCDGQHNELRATICWTDPPHEPVEPALNDRTKMLVNDLDLRITAPDGTTYAPWVLDVNNPSVAATTGDNVTDNAEQVVIPNAGVGLYHVTVTHKGTLTNGGQVFSLVLSGLPTLDCNYNGTPDEEEVAADPNMDCNHDGVPDSCERGLLPAITSQPGDVAICVGHPATFGVVANGSPPLQYQWRHDGVPITGANQASYAVPQVGAVDAGAYDVVVSNVCGTYTSAVGRLVVQRTAIVQPPVDQAAMAGTGATFTVTATGPEPLSYQWRFEGQDLAGRVSSALTIPFALVANAGRYDVVVTGPCGSATSSAATLTVTLAMGTGPTPDQRATGVSIDADLVWQAVVGASEYDVYFGTATDPPKVGTAKLPEWALAPLSYATTYYWKIVARTVPVASSGLVWSFTTHDPPPVAPSSPSPGDGVADVPVDVELSWRAATGADLYQVLVGENTDLKDARFLGSASDARISVPGLVAGTTYYWRVIAKNEIGATSGPIWKFTTRTPPPATDGGGSGAPTTGTRTDTTGQTPVDDGTSTDTVPPEDVATSDTTAPETDSALAAPAASGLCPTAGAGMLLLSTLACWRSRPRR